MLFDEVDIAVAQAQLDVDLGVRFQEGRCHGHHVQTAEHDRRSHHELALDLGVGTSGGALGFVDLLQDLTARVQVVATRIGQHELARRARDEARLEVRLQVRELAADGGQRHVQAPPGRRQAAPIDDGGKQGHGFKAVHCSNI